MRDYLHACMPVSELCSDALIAAARQEERPGCDRRRRRRRMNGRLGRRQARARSAPDRGPLANARCADVAERGANSCPSPSIEVVAVTNALRSDQDLTRGLIEQIAGGE